MRLPNSILLLVAVAAVPLACGPDTSGAPETLPPIRTTTTTSTTTIPRDDRIRIYTVKPGENLSMIARSFEVPLQTLIAANADIIDDPNNVQPGVTLEIPPVVLVEELPTTVETSTTELP